MLNSLPFDPSTRPSTLRRAQGWPAQGVPQGRQAQDVRQQGAYHFLYFVFALYERKNEGQKEEKYRCE